jgi:hypothetical protein
MNYQSLIERNVFSLMDPLAVQWLKNHCSTLSSGDIVVELGTFLGGTIKSLAESNPNIIFHTIDINDAEWWHERNYISNVRKVSGNNLINFNKEDYLKIQDLHLNHLINVVRHTGSSLTLTIPNISLLISDSSHNEELTYQELNHFWPLIKKGGSIIGDDFNNMPEVKRAFIRFIRENNLSYSRIYSNQIRIVK